MDAIEKIEYEYKIFYLDCVSQSKPGIYSRCGEIYLKRKIKDILTQLLTENKTLGKKITRIDNVLDDVYRFVKDNEVKNKPVDVLVKHWINMK